MPGLLCLQGGREFTRGCDEMDRQVLVRSGASAVVVLAGAARVGDDYDGAVRRAVRHFERLGVRCRGVVDPRVDVDATIADLNGADLIVLPGGSPSSLLATLTDLDGGRVGSQIREMWESGVAVSGASAGAMVLCSQMVRPERGDVVEGLAFVEGLALPHWQPGADRRWSVPDVALWGLPECGGVIVDGTDIAAVGAGEPSRRLEGIWSAVAR